MLGSSVFYVNALAILKFRDENNNCLYYGFAVLKILPSKEQKNR